MLVECPCRLGHMLGPQPQWWVLGGLSQERANRQLRNQCPALGHRADPGQPQDLKPELNSRGWASSPAPGVTVTRATDAQCPTPASSQLAVRNQLHPQGQALGWARRNPWLCRAAGGEAGCGLLQQLRETWSSGGQEDGPLGQGRRLPGGGSCPRESDLFRGPGSSA